LLIACGTWNTLLVLWIAALIHLRGAQPPRRDWSWCWSVAFALVAGAWWAPGLCSLALVYLHPLVALWILDRELLRHQPEWRAAYHAYLCFLPLALGILWWRLAGTPSLPGEDALTLRIAQHAGAHILRGVSSHLLVATHVFLEMIHYGIWLVAVPWLSLKERPWELRTVPLARRSRRWQAAVAGVLGLGAVFVLFLWSCFLADYPTTRDVYFTVAMLHVLAEVPFLLRAL
jgi:hypothetical protein